jgi:hypothetical protein
MAQHYVFNGDADGLCALQQLRLEEPGSARLVTGTKRDIDLVRRVAAQPGDCVTVLDVSFETNAAGVRDLLASGVRVRYFDHHYPGEPPAHAALELHIDTSAAVCTSLIVDRFLGGRRRTWAAVGAFGDSLEDSARALLGPMQRDGPDLEALQQLGACINYNAYGDTLEELHIAPAALHERLLRYEDPLEFVRREPLFGELRANVRRDMALAQETRALASSESAAVFLLPDAGWARRVSGVWAHELAGRHPGRAHAVLTHKPGGGYVVSVRAPKLRPRGAAQLCRGFPTGGGREGAAGINRLPEEMLQLFCDKFLRHYAA